MTFARTRRSDGGMVLWLDDDAVILEAELDNETDLIGVKGMGYTILRGKALSRAEVRIWRENGGR